MSYYYSLNVILPLIFLTLCAKESKYNNSSSGTLIRSGLSSGISIYMCSGSGGISTWSGYGGGVAGLGDWWVHRYSWLPGTGFLDHTGSTSSAVERYSSWSESTSGVGGGVSSNIRHQWTPWWKGNSSLSHLGVKGEMGHCAPLWFARMKDASVVETE